MFTTITENHSGIYADRREDARSFSSFDEVFSLDTVGERIKAFAKAKFKTQTAFGEAVGMSSGQLSDYVSGRRMPGADVLQKFAAVGMNVDWLLTGRGEMTIPDDPPYEVWPGTRIPKDYVIQEIRIAPESEFREFVAETLKRLHDRTPEAGDDTEEEPV